ncbi:proline-rich membrane anchor 1-like isoform X1 [Megalobrama amblycephala]|uniref:proline-rich membrane anchor 1-like isoform X1 n=1 Tax=Megalobrama amblycephala TaxID=75352 RepID=UPI002013F474|nr:proline-rich membrane anchor 1-like isoform X1 [Megalobrama amblycephala]
MLESLRFHPWPFVFAHCLLSACLLSSQAELQSFCSQHDINTGGEGRQLLCHRRPYPPLPPPPPPPPPPPALLSMGKTQGSFSKGHMEIVIQISSFSSAQ